MPSFETKNFGSISYETNAVVEFPRGLPGFEARRLFLALHFDQCTPLIFLQSLEEPDLCFITLPVLAIDPHYRLTVSAEDRALIGLPAERELQIGQDVVSAAIVTVHDGNSPTANLLAPVVINLSNRVAVQTVATDSGYSLQHVLVAEEVAVCS